MARQSSGRWVAAALGGALLLLLLAALASLPGRPADLESTQAYACVDRQAAQQAWADARALSLATSD